MAAHVLLLLSLSAYHVRIIVEASDIDNVNDRSIQNNGSVDQIENVDSKSVDNRQCDRIESNFARSNNRACRCFQGVPDFDNINFGKNFDDINFGKSSSKEEPNSTKPSIFPNSTDRLNYSNRNRSLFGNIWIGCTKSNFPAINRDLKSLPDDVVLSKLWIWDNFVAMFIPTMFSKIKTEKLIFEHNHLFELSPGRLALNTTAPYLRHLILRNNVVRHVKERIFRDLSNLITLDMSFNFVESLDQNSLGDRMLKLRYLSFENNRLTKLKNSVFGGLRNLERLNLARNRLEDLGDQSTFANLTKLRVLNLANNRLESIPDWLFDQAPNLHILNLAHNRLRQLDGAGFDRLRDLKRLYLHNNLLTITPKFNLPNLQILTLDENSIAEFRSDWAKSLNSLKLLSLTSNRISRPLERELFEGLSSLNVLSMQNNSVEVVKDDAFGYFMPNLHKLLLSSNRLRKLSPGSFRGLGKLNILNLARNNLRDRFNADLLRDLSNLRRLHLNRNELKTTDSKLLNAFSTIQYVNLADNPWQCDCNALNLSTWMKLNADKIVDIENTACTLPDHARISFPDFHESESAKKSCSSQSESSGVDHGPSKIDKIQSHSSWITVLAFVLAVSSVLFLLAVACLFLKDASKLKKNSVNQSLESNLNISKPPNENYAKVGGSFLRRIPVEMMHLMISKKSNPVTVPLLVERSTTTTTEK